MYLHSISLSLVKKDDKIIIFSGKEKCILMAHDWGAVLAWRLVIQYPDLFTGHISMNGPHPGVFGKHLRNSFKQIRMSWLVLEMSLKMGLSSYWTSFIWLIMLGKLATVSRQ